MLRRLLLIVLLLQIFSLVHAAPRPPLKLVDEKPGTKVYPFTVEGEHTDAKVEAMKKSVCSRGYESCRILIDSEKQVSEIRITPKPGKIVDRSKLRALVREAGLNLVE
jgi:hypothetical protein